MEREIIIFKSYRLPIYIDNLFMQEYGTYRGLHSHMAIEIIIVKNGILNCYINGDTISVKANQTVLINSNMIHQLSSPSADITYMQIDISHYIDNIYHTDFIALYEFMLLSNSKPYMIFSDNQEINEILKKIDTKYHDTQECSSWYLNAYIYELLAFMHANSFVKPPTSFITQIKKIEKIVCYLDANFKLPIRLEDICAATGYNKYAVCHIFKSVTGRTVFDYINFLRTHHAADKLKQSNATILEIATECGFSSASYFNRVFKNVMGCAPSDYRKYQQF